MRTTLPTQPRQDTVRFPRMGYTGKASAVGQSPQLPARRVPPRAREQLSDHVADERGVGADTGSLVSSDGAISSALARARSVSGCPARAPRARCGTAAIY